MSYNRSAYESPEIYVTWILHAVFTEDVTGRMEVFSNQQISNADERMQALSASISVSRY